MVSFNEQEAAHTLVVELLAHQFAYPVQWIETQESLFQQHKIERTIEIGPSATLTGMAKQTLNTKYHDHDTARSIRRSLLTAKDHASEVYFEHDVQEKEEKPKNIASKPGNDSKDLSVKPIPVNIPSPAVPQLPAVSADQNFIPMTNAAFADTPVNVEDILLTIVAQKLKKSAESIPRDSTIKRLVGGRSTLENEIVGDLLSEFGAIPERAEESPLHELAQTLSSWGDRRLGKQTTAMLQQVVSGKMPGGFGINSTRKYLEERWGFASGRQDAVLLAMIAGPPPSRMPNEKEAEAYIDVLATMHVQHAGLTIATQQRTTQVEANPEAVKQIIKKQEDFARQKLKLYADYLDFDLQAASDSSHLSAEVIADLQSQLNLWSSELGNEYATGIAPSFDPLKIRFYSSYWNWALQDLLTVTQEIARGEVDTGICHTDLAFPIANKATQRLIDVMQYLLCHSKNQDAKAFLRILIGDSKSSLENDSVFKYNRQSMSPRTAIDSEGKIRYSEVPRKHQEENLSNGTLPTRHIRNKLKGRWEFNSSFSDIYFNGLDEIAHSGISFKDKTVLLTGAGPNSIGAEIMNGLLAGGAKVIVTTSSTPSQSAYIYQQAYAAHGGKDSNLWLVPFNQGSRQDTEALVSYIYDTQNGLGMDLDFVIPFAAIGTAGRPIDMIDSKSELGHRIMLINVIRLIGEIKKLKEAAGSTARPTHVILPLSPNHGNFGNDGLYAESKIALEGLFNKWHSEAWGNYISLCGASIGWTRGTGLMNQNDIVAEGLEELGGRTFSRTEMAVSILGLMYQPLVESCQVEPLYADLTGGLDTFPDLHSTISNIRGDLNSLSDIYRAVKNEVAEDTRLIHGEKEVKADRSEPLKLRANLQIGFPELPDYTSELSDLNVKLGGMVDLERVVVIVGFSELGPCGNARTRWEMEAFGKFTNEGCTEMAWIMGLIKYSNKQNVDGSKRSGWVDAKTNAPVEESEIQEHYEKQILEHSGVRLVEPTLFDSYDPHKKRAMQEVVIQQDLAPFQASQETAADFKRQHGDKAQIVRVQGTSDFEVIIKKGASLMIPKAIDFQNDVAGQIPQGWNPRNYGISEEMITQVDPTTLYVFVSTVEALFAAGITDPYEIYEYIHISQLGNCIGTGLGGAASFSKMMKDRFLEEPVQKDIMQETFPNTTAAWVNMLLFSSTGPIRTPVGACATVLESLDSASDLIVSGKAKMCLVGAGDDFTEEVSNEFANMKATSNASDERAKGRSPKEMSRPMASTRKGFMESHGAAMQVACTATLALKMGLPIYAVVAYTSTASDKAGRSIPAAGKGMMVNAREATARFTSPLLDISYRKRQIEIRRSQLAEWKEEELKQIEETVISLEKQDPTFDASDYRQYMSAHINRQSQKDEEELLHAFGNNFWKEHPEISPIRGALATWGLGIDDLNVASFHGTSTAMNDRNESEIIQDQLSHLGRRKGNVIMAVCQKHLTGHPKGPAGGWMLNGCLQILRTGLVPGNRNVDNLTDDFQRFDLIAYPNKSIQTNGVDAFSVTSFGFGQKGAQTICVHPKFLFATLDRAKYEDYATRVGQRQKRASAAWNAGLIGNSLFVAKDQPPWQKKDEMSVMLNPMARLSSNVIV